MLLGSKRDFPMFSRTSHVPSLVLQVPEGSDRRPLVTYPLVIRMECLGEAAQKDGHTLAVRPRSIATLQTPEGRG